MAPVAASESSSSCRRAAADPGGLAAPSAKAPERPRCDEVTPGASFVIGKAPALLEADAGNEAVNLPFAVELAESLIDDGEEQRAQELLEQALLRSARADREYAARARLALARLFHKQGKTGRAAEQYRFLSGRTERDAWRDEADRYLQGR